MRRSGPLFTTGCAIALAIASSGVTAAHVRAGTSARVSERILANGAALTSIRSPGLSVSFIGRPGSTAVVSSNGSSVSASLQSARRKTARDARAYRDAGRSVIDDLVALGMPRADAQREFGGLATLDGAGGAASRIGPRAASLKAAAQPPTTPYDSQCASISVADGKITGYGCSTFFLVRQDGDDWWLTTKMKISAHSTDESWFSPKRLAQLGWRAGWATGNVLYDWDPYQTRAIGQCLTLTVKSSSPFADVSVQGTVCPDSLGPWSVTTARSGGIWNGMENGTDYEGAIATQAVHSPPGAPVSYQSAWTLSYCDLWCN